MTGKNNESNRRRRWAPKARTGCRTCKTRHVKCDEARPICKRCVLSGFRCDGYPSIPKKEAEPNSSLSDEANEPTASESEESQDIEPTSATTQNSDSSLLLVTPSSPYRTNTEQHKLKFFVDMTANMVGRSRAAPYFWRTLVPQAAWQHPSVRHAILACATINQSLINRERGIDQKRSDLAVLDHTNQAMQSLLHDKPPMDVILLTSATLGILDLFQGSWENACMHVTSGAKLAKHARSDPSSNEYIAFYCEAFASALPNVLKAAQDEKSRITTGEDNGVRLYEAVLSLRFALQDFQKITPRVEQLDSTESARILTVINLATTEIEWLLSRWEEMLERGNYPSPDEKGQSLIHRVESPWSAVTQALEHYLDNGGAFDVPKFEVAMERTMPFFAMAKAGPNIEMREHAVEMMWRGIMLRGKDTFPLEKPAEPIQRATISEEDSEGDDG